MLMAVLELCMSTTNDVKLFAVIKDGVVVDGWLAESLAEAQIDNPKNLVKELTLEDNLITIGSVWKGN